MTVQTLVETDDHGMDNTYTVGQHGVIEIVEHKAQGEGDKWYYDIEISGGEIIRKFSFKEVKYQK